MKALPPEDENCDNCVHERDSGTEYCGCCGEGTLSNWREDPANLEERADKRIAELEAELADIKETHARIVADEGAEDEVHCTCVPALRAKIKELEAERDMLTVGAVESGKDALALLKLSEFLTEHGVRTHDSSIDSAIYCIVRLQAIIARMRDQEQEKDTQINELEAVNAELRSRIQELEAEVAGLRRTRD